MALSQTLQTCTCRRACLKKFKKRSLRESNVAIHTLPRKNAVVTLSEVPVGARRHSLRECGAVREPSTRAQWACAHLLESAEIPGKSLKLSSNQECCYANWSRKKESGQTKKNEEYLPKRFSRNRTRFVNYSSSICDLRHCKKVWATSRRSGNSKSVDCLKRRLTILGRDAKSFGVH